MPESEWEARDLFRKRRRLADAPDGRARYRVVQTPHPQHYRDEATGELRDLDPRWVDRGDAFVFGGMAYRLYVPKDRVAFRYRDRRGVELGQVLATTPDQVAPELRQRTLPDGLSEAHMLWWPNVWPGHDICLLPRREACIVGHVLRDASARDAWAWRVRDPDRVVHRYEDRPWGREGRDEQIPSDIPDQSRRVRVRTRRDVLADEVTVRVGYRVDGVVVDPALPTRSLDVIRSYPVWVVE